MSCVAGRAHANGALPSLGVIWCGPRGGALMITVRSFFSSCGWQAKWHQRHWDVWVGNLTCEHGKAMKSARRSSTAALPPPEPADRYKVS